MLHFTNILLSPNICAFYDTEIFLHSHHIFSALPNLTFLTSETQKFKFYKFLPCTLSPIQNEPKEPKRSQINPHLDHETAVDILLEDAAYRCFDLARTDLAHLSPNRATHLKSPEKYLLWSLDRLSGHVLHGEEERCGPKPQMRSSYAQTDRLTPTSVGGMTQFDGSCALQS